MDYLSLTSGYINLLGFCFFPFPSYYSVECQTKSLSNLCVRFAMFPIFLAILKFFTIQRMNFKIRILNIVLSPFHCLYFLLHSADNSMKSIHTMNTKVIINSTGHSTWFASTSLKASCKINVRYFPFDEQICYLILG